MRIAKWGNSLAVRLPTKIVRELELREGDELSMEFEKDAEEGKWRVALMKLNALPKIVPADYKFRREDAYDDE